MSTSDTIAPIVPITRTASTPNRTRPTTRLSLIYAPPANTTCDCSHRLLQMEMFIDSLHEIFSTTDTYRLTQSIIDNSCKILHCERATLYYVDNEQLILMIAKGAKNIRLPITKGIAGSAATSKQTINIPDAYADVRFDPSFDLETGFRTRNVLCTPVFDADKNVIAVLQLINKMSDNGITTATFTDTDIHLIENLAFHCSVGLRNVQQYEQTRAAQVKMSSLVEVVQMLHSQPSTNSLIFTLSARAPTLVDADRCTLYLTDKNREELVMMTGDVDIRIPLNKGIAGYVATTGQIVNIPDCYADARFNQDVDKKTGYKTQNMLCMPIPSGTGETIGVLQLINRLDDQQFSTSDENTLTTLLSIAGPILKKANIFGSKERKNSVDETAVPQVGAGVSTPGAAASPSTAATGQGRPKPKYQPTLTSTAFEE